MTPTAPLASTIALHNQLNSSFQLYQALKMQFQLSAVLLMLTGITGTCVHCYNLQNISI